MVARIAHRPGNSTSGTIRMFQNRLVNVFILQKYNPHPVEGRVKKFGAEPRFMIQGDSPHASGTMPHGPSHIKAHDPSARARAPPNPLPPTRASASSCRCGCGLTQALIFASAAVCFCCMHPSEVHCLGAEAGEADYYVHPLRSHEESGGAHSRTSTTKCPRCVSLTFLM